jgi:hypothetical protein
VVSTTPRPLYSREIPGTHCTGGWVGPMAGLDVCEKSHPTGIRSPDRPARSYSLYRLSYPAHDYEHVLQENCGPGSSVGIVTGYGLDGPGINLRLTYKFWLAQKQEAITWIIVHLGNYLLQTQRRLLLRDYLDFLRGARWKEYQHTPRRHMMGRYMDVL